jgi:5-methylcytosine-specific restriction endonuclease McrA
MKGSPPLRASLELQLIGQASQCRSIDEIRQRHPDEYEHALHTVEDTFVRYPIPLLQVVGSALIPFLYEPDWPEQTSIRTLRREERDELRLLPGVADRLVTLGPLLRPLIELHWTRDVARWTGIATEDEHLRAHLFGSSRTSFLAGLRRRLVELQDGSCFYCGDQLGGRPEVDHILAWSRWPNDAIENLVLADRCNSAKSDHLAASMHVTRWAAHIQTHSAELSAIAEEQRWASDLPRTSGLMTTTYGHLASGTPLWVLGREFELASGPLVVDAP